MNRLIVAAALLAATLAPPASAQITAPRHPWMNTALTADQRADLLLHALTLDEKIQLLHGTGDPHDGPPDALARDSNGGSGYVPGFADKDFPGLQIDDSASGVVFSGENGRYSTALPSNIAAASSWDTSLVQQYGAMIADELRDQGYNMTLGGGVNLTREPRDARTFEYMGEDPLLAGTLVGYTIRGVQSRHVLGHIKHFAVNDQESGRHAVSSEIGERAMRETDLLAFQLGIEIGQPGAVMCSYNRVNGVYACENPFLLSTVLKGDWHYPGFVISDWLATHSTVAASHAGLDHEEPSNVFYGPAMKKAVEDGQVSQAELDEHVHRILRSMFAAGIVDDPPHKRVPDVFRHAAFARQVEQQSIVLLRNQNSVLPLSPTQPQTILVIGRNADKGIISGGGSSQVDPPGGNAIGDIPEKDRRQDWQKAVWFPGSPLEAIRRAAPAAHVNYLDGADPARAAAAARNADVVIVFAYQWMAEGIDLPSLALPDSQNPLIAAVTAANPRTVVVLETGGPVTMPWIDSSAAVLEAWYGGTSGAEAIADVLFGAVDPSGRLPVTFPLRDADLPHPAIVPPPPASQEDWSDEAKMSRKLLAGLPPFSVHYDEGLEVGYRWYDARRKPVLFPFGFGLSYTHFAYRDLRAEAAPDKAKTLTVSLRLRNTGSRAGIETAQVYSSLPANIGEPPHRLLAWQKVQLAPGEEKVVMFTIPCERLEYWDEAQKQWRLAPGTYTIAAGSSSRDLPLVQSVTLP